MWRLGWLFGAKGGICGHFELYVVEMRLVELRIDAIDDAVQERCHIIALNGENATPW